MDKFLITEEEKSRILGMHISRTQRQYLMEEEEEDLGGAKIKNFKLLVDDNGKKTNSTVDVEKNGKTYSFTYKELGTPGLGFTLSPQCETNGAGEFTVANWPQYCKVAITQLNGSEYNCDEKKCETTFSSKQVDKANKGIIQATKAY
jgi:hypothetical protein